MPLPLADGFRPPASSWPFRSRLTGGLALALLLVGAAGCVAGGSSVAGGNPSDYAVSQGEIAYRPLPNVRRMEHHPDSMAHLSLEAEDGKIDLDHERSYRNMLLEWTAGVPGGRARSLQSHATLWSKELSLLSLEPEHGLQTLTEKLARDLIAQRLRAYQDFVQIDVYVFRRSSRFQRIENLRVDRAVRVYLQDGEGRQYRPERIKVQAPLESFYRGRRAVYGRNAVYFKRFRDGRDLLNTDRLELHVDQARFVWRFPRPEDDGRAVSSEF